MLEPLIDKTGDIPQASNEPPSISVAATLTKPPVKQIVVSLQSIVGAVVSNTSMFPAQDPTLPLASTTNKVTVLKGATLEQSKVSGLV